MMTLNTPLPTKITLLVVLSALSIYILQPMERPAEAQAPSKGVLQIHPDNPRYFTNDGGRALYLTGSHTWYNVTQNGVDISSVEYLDWMRMNGHNFSRLWTGWDRIQDADSGEPLIPYVWERPGPGAAGSDGQPKFDLTKFNERYFQLVREWVAQHQERNMYCSVMLFGSGNTFNRAVNWPHSVWNPANNINPETAMLSSDRFRFYDPSPELRELQHAIVRKFVDTLDEYDNFTWEIINEGGPHSVQWQYEMIQYLRSYEAGKPKQHLVGMTGGWEIGDSLLDSPADWISPDRELGEYFEGGPAEYTRKIVLNDTDHLWGFSEPDKVEEYRKWVWETFTRGNHPLFMDPYNDEAYSTTPGEIDPAYEPVRKAMGATSNLARRFNLATMIPSDDPADCSTTYCLCHPGEAYLAYQPTREAFTLHMHTGTYQVEWMDTQDGSASTSILDVSAEREISFAIPSHVKDDALLSLRRATTPSFADVPLGHPYHDHIEALYREGYTAGCNTDPLMYCPEQAMNRAESAVFVERGIQTTDFEPLIPTGQTFTDVPLDYWGAGWIESLWEDGYTAGCETEPLAYCPLYEHTRAEGAVFYLRMLHGPGYEPPAATGHFEDVPLDWWGAGWVEAAYRAGLIEACQGTPLRYCPNDPLARALAAFMMIRAKGLPLQ